LVTRIGCGLALALLGVALTSCVRDEQLLSVTGGAGGLGAQAGSSGVSAGTAGVSGNAGVAGGGRDANGAIAGADSVTEPWLEANCIQALSAGKTGDPCKGTFKCLATQGCCQYLARCTADVFSIDQTCSGCITACTADSDCLPGELCTNYQCRTCPTVGCPASWSALERHGCAVCVPPNQCKSDQDCGKGLTCHAGLSCLPGCNADPACCFGDFCGSPACGAPLGFDCASVGCADGQFCKVGSAVSSDCRCDELKGIWVCTNEPANQCFSL